MVSISDIRQLKATSTQFFVVEKKCFKKNFTQDHISPVKLNKTNLITVRRIL